MKNTWGAKLIRTCTSVLPVAPDRHGQCVRCGACCALPNRCPFLTTTPDGLTACRIHKFRPLNCRKYPRTAREHITSSTCGFRFGAEP